MIELGIYLVGWYLIWKFWNLIHFSFHNGYLGQLLWFIIWIVLVEVVVERVLKICLLFPGVWRALWPCCQSFVHHLVCWDCILVNLFEVTIFLNCYWFWFGESVVHQSLVVMNKISLSFEVFIPVVLTFGEYIFLLGLARIILLCSLAVNFNLGIASQSIVKCSLVVSWLIYSFQTSSTVWNVSVSSTAIVGISYWFRMDLRQIRVWSLLCHNKWS